MAAARAHPDQLRVLLQQGLKGDDVTRDHCFHGGLEALDGTFAADFIGESCEVGPAFEAILERNDYLGVS
jgi:hypothetical protein